MNKESLLLKNTKWRFFPGRTSHPGERTFTALAFHSRGTRAPPLLRKKNCRASPPQLLASSIAPAATSARSPHLHPPPRRIRGGGARRYQWPLSPATLRRSCSPRSAASPATSPPSATTPGTPVCLLPRCATLHRLILAAAASTQSPRLSSFPRRLHLLLSPQPPSPPFHRPPDPSSRSSPPPPPFPDPLLRRRPWSTHAWDTPLTGAAAIAHTRAPWIQYWT
jgi:hypothetical protein